MKRGFTKDWGTFLGELSGYSVEEGTELEMMTVPYGMRPTSSSKCILSPHWHRQRRP